MASMLEEGFYCVPEAQLEPLQRTIYCALSLASGVAGLGGAAWQALQWRPFLRAYQRRRRPSPNPLIVVSLAVADLLACLGVLLRSTTMLVTEPPLATTNGTTFHPLDGQMSLIVTGHAVEVINQYFYGVTFLWTTVYALDILLQLCHMEIPSLAYHVICWLTPALTTTASIISISRTPGSPNVCAYGGYLIVRYISFFILILLAMFGNPIIYVLCNKAIDRRMRESGLMDNHNQAVMGALRRKFLSVILIFTICWFPNIVDAVVLIVGAAIKAPPASLARFFPLWAIEAVLNPLQGLLNCLLYGRHMLFRRIARDEGRIHQPEEINEDTPILYTRNTANLFASE